MTRTERKLTKQEERLRLKYPETETFLWHNENPKGHITGDCTVRAIAGATEQSWCAVLDGLHATYRDTSDMDMKAVNKYLESCGWLKHKQPRHSNGKKFTGAELARWFSANFPDGEAGNVICSVANHMMCLKPTFHGDGINCRYKVIDIWNSSGKTIGNYWLRRGVVLHRLPGQPLGAELPKKSNRKE